MDKRILNTVPVLLTNEDGELIYQSRYYRHRKLKEKAELEQLISECRILIEQCKKDARELTLEKLAEKFDCSVTTIKKYDYFG